VSPGLAAWAALRGPGLSWEGPDRATRASSVKAIGKARAGRRRRFMAFIVLKLLFL
jgi:hypothetical protein